MRVVDLAEAKADLDSLIAIVAEGETVRIQQHGESVADLVPPRKKPIDVAKLRALTDSMKVCGEGAGDFVRRMRDEDRY
jgi:antitoxin (DNA-binding transcriptional repressor) of toxin-antitoxin stability system